MDEVKRWKAKLKKDPELAKDFTLALQQNSAPFAGDYAPIFHAIEDILGLTAGNINYRTIDADVLVQMICENI